MAAVSSQPATVAPASLQIRLADLAGDKFKDMFYAIFDSHRNDLPRFFSATSLVVWEGSSVNGPANLTQLFNMLPPTKHTIVSIDTHIIEQPTNQPGSQTNPLQSLLISIAGTVVYGLDTAHPRGFFHSFVIEKTSQSIHHAISAASFRSRHVNEPEKPRKQNFQRHST